MKPGSHSNTSTSPAGKTLAAMGGTLVSRLLGLARDMLVAAVLGAGADIFVAAFRIPNIARRIAGEGSLGLAYTTTLGRLMPNSRYTEEAARTCKHTALAFAGIGLCLALVLAIYPKGSIALVAPGLLSRDTLPIAMLCLLLCLPYLPLAGISAVLSATLVAGGKMAQTTFAPVFLNAGILAFGLLALCAFAPLPPAAWFALGASAGGVAQCGWLLWQCRKLRQRDVETTAFAQSARLAGNGVKEILKQTPEALFTSCGTQLHFVIAAVVASFLPEGNLAALYFAERLVEFPLMLAGAIPALVMAPDFARLHGPALQASLTATLRLGFFLSIPAAIGLFFLAPPLALLFFGHGAFDAQKTIATGQVLACIALSLPLVCMVRPLAAAISALQNQRSTQNIPHPCNNSQKMATRATLWSLLATALACVTLTPLLGLVGTGLALNIGALTQAILLYNILQKKGITTTLTALCKSILPVVLGGGILGFALAFLPDLTAGSVSIIWLAGCIGGIVSVAGASWIVVYALLGNEEAISLCAALRKKL